MQSLRTHILLSSADDSESTMTQQVIKIQSYIVTLNYRTYNIYFITTSSVNQSYSLTQTWNTVAVSQ